MTEVASPLVETAGRSIAALLLWLADWSLRWAVIIAITAGVLRLAARCRTATSYLLCVIALLAGLALPALPRWGPGFYFGAGLPISSANGHSPSSRRAQALNVTSVDRDLAIITGLISQADDDADAVTQISQDPYGAPLSMKPRRTPINIQRLAVFSLAGIWMAGISVSLVRVAVGMVLLDRLRRTAVAVEIRAAGLFDACREQIGLRRRVRLAAHSIVRSPITVGPFQPTILVTPEWSNLPTQVQRSGLLHELAHVARYDDWGTLFAEFVRAVFFFHPLVHWLINRLYRERELLCDEVAMTHGSNPREYARMLLEFARAPGLNVPPFVVSRRYAVPLGERRTVRIRIERLLDDKSRRWMSPLPRSRAVLLTLTFLGLVAGFGSLRVLAIDEFTEPANSDADRALESTSINARTGGSIPLEELDKTESMQETDGAKQSNANDVAEVPSQDLRAGGDENKRYFLIGAKPDRDDPPDGYRLLVVLPGGSGTPEFHPFVKSIYKNALTDNHLVAQLVSVKWTPEQVVVWPTKGLSVFEQQFTTEELVESVVADVRKRHRLDDRHIFALGWSSGGPAAYAISLQEQKSVTGAYVAMSVFKPELLPHLQNAKGQRFLIDHSPNDGVCPYWMAESARDLLRENGATVKMITYNGGHGWHGDVFGRIRQGIAWLENPTLENQNTPEPTRPTVAERLPLNDSFENGREMPDGWQHGAAIDGVEYVWDQSESHSGSSSLCLKKTANRFFPIAQWYRSFAHESDARSLRLSAHVKAHAVTKAILDVQFFDSAGRGQHEWAAYIGQKEPGDPVADHDWKEYDGIVSIPAGTKRIAVAVQIYGPGTAWFDDVKAEYREEAVAVASNVAFEPQEKTAGSTQKPASLPIADSLETGQKAPDGWEQGMPVDGVEYIWDKNTSSDGKASLCLKKDAQRFFPIAQWVRTVPHDGSATRIKLAAQVKAEKASKAVLDVQFQDGSGQWRHEWAAYIGAKNPGDPPADHDWKDYSGTVAIPPGTKRIAIALQIYGPGTVWFDQVRAEYVAADSPKDARTPSKAKAGEPGKDAKSLPFTDSLEAGKAAPDGWQKGAAVPGVEYLWDKKVGSEGNASLCLKKTAQRFFPIAEWTRTVNHDGSATKLKLSAKVKAQQASKAILDVQFLDGTGKMVAHEWAAYIGAKNAGDPKADHDWKDYSGTVTIPSGTRQLRIALQLYGPGTVWFDEVSAAYDAP